MTRFKRTLCAGILMIGISSSVFAGNIGGMRTTSAGNIGGMRTTSVGNIGGTRTGNIGGTRTGNIGGVRAISPIDLRNGFPISDTLIAMFRVFLEIPIF